MFTKNKRKKSHFPLSEAETGERCRVYAVGIGERAAGTLGAAGLSVGTRVRVFSRSALGCVVDIGRVRLALSKRTAARVGAVRVTGAEDAPL